MTQPIITPIIIPVNQKPEYCPGCHLAAEKRSVEICAHCKYQYPEEKLTVLDYILVPVALFFIFVLLIIGCVLLARFTAWFASLIWG